MKENYLDFGGLKDDKKLDWFIFYFIIPLFLIIVYIMVHLHPELERVLILQTSNPTWISIYLSNFVHTDFWHHLGGNLLSYFILIYLILFFRTDRKKFYINMALFFTVLPVLCSLSTIYLASAPPPSFGVLWQFLGFSGIVSGLAGYLLYSVYWYIREKWEVPLNIHFFFSILAFNLLIITFTYKWFWMSVFIFLIFLIALYLAKNGLTMTISKIIDKWNEIKQKNVKVKICKLMIFLFTVSFLFGSAMGLFPVNAKGINILAHYAGYCFGALVPLIFVDGGVLVLKKLLDSDKR